MPIDSGIYSQLQPVRLNTPFQNLSEILQVRQQQESARGLREQREAIAAQRREQTEKLQQANDDRAATGRAIQQGGGVRAQTLDWARANAPNTVPALTAFFDTSDEKANTIKQARLKISNDEADFLGDVADGILRNGGTPEALQLGLNYAVEQFPDYAEAAQKIQAQLQAAGPDRIKPFLEQVRDTAPSRRQKAVPPPATVAPGEGVRNAAGGYDVPIPKPAEKETRGLDVQAADALAKGDRATYDRLMQVKRDMGRADDRPVDPTLAAIRDLTLQNARQNVGTLPYRTQQRVDAAAKGFDSQPVVKRVQTMAEAVALAKGFDPKTTNPADDQALIYAFAKAMDPDSVVREGEYATVQKYAQSWADNLGFNAARIFSNSPFLTEQARRNMKATIESKYKATRTQFDNLKRSYAIKINALTGLADGDQRLIDYAGGFPEDAPKPEAGAGVEEWVRDASGKLVKKGGR